MLDSDLHASTFQRSQDEPLWPVAQMNHSRMLRPEQVRVSARNCNGSAFSASASRPSPLSLSLFVSYASLTLYLLQLSCSSSAAMTRPYSRPPLPTRIY